jgi:hypothetical protein
MAGRRNITAPFQPNSRGGAAGAPRQSVGGEALSGVNYRNFAFQPLESVDELQFDKYCGPTPESNWVGLYTYCVYTTVCILYCMYTVCILYVYCMYTTVCIYTIHYTLYTIHYTLYTIHYTNTHIHTYTTTPHI